MAHVGEMSGGDETRNLAVFGACPVMLSARWHHRQLNDASCRYKFALSVFSLLCINFFLHQMHPKKEPNRKKRIAGLIWV